MDRRKFLSLIGTGAVIAAAPLSLTPIADGIRSEAEALYYGDGVHDATVYLQGLIDKGGVVNIPQGTYTISSTLFVKGNDVYLNGNDSRFQTNCAITALDIAGKNHTVANFHFSRFDTVLMLRPS